MTVTLLRFEGSVAISRRGLATVPNELALSAEAEPLEAPTAEPYSYGEATSEPPADADAEALQTPTDTGSGCRFRYRCG